MTNRTESRILALFALVAVVALIAIPTARADSTATDGSASVPYANSRCPSTRLNVTSTSAGWCRSRGWVISTRYVVDPNRVLRYQDLPVCRNEDGEQRSACTWNVEGDSAPVKHGGYVYIVHNTTHGKHYLYLNTYVGNPLHLVTWYVD